MRFVDLRGDIYLYCGDLPSQRRDYTRLNFIGLSLTKSDTLHIRHNVAHKIELCDDSVTIVQSEDVFEHIEYNQLPSCIDEIYRVLKPGGLLRISVPDYRCDVLERRSYKDSDGKIYYDPGGGGAFDYLNHQVTDGGHVWFPRYEMVRELLSSSKFEVARFLHYYDSSDDPIMNPIDYSLGYISRTPDHDDRVSRPRRPMSIVVDCWKKYSTELAGVTKGMLVDQLDSFLELYDRRPIKDNEGGMRSPHMFATYFMLRHLDKKFIIESGVWKGQSTWLIEQACPRATVISIDPNLHYRSYISQRVHYESKDFSQLDLPRKYGVDPAATVCFFDDHQNALHRIQFAIKHGYRYLIFEDNYPPGKGDCLSVKKLLAQHDDAAKYLIEHLKVYYEFPPVYRREITRWNTPWVYPTKQPLLTEVTAKYRIFDDEATSYTWIAYIELK